VNRRAAKTAVEQLVASKATILGSILNRSSEEEPYYYAHYYKHDYAGYYTSEKPA